jgi:hypothetical protein
MLYDIERYRKLELGISFYVRLFGKGSYMKGQLLTKVHRRNLLQLAVAGTVAAATSTVAPAAVAAEPASSSKRKARYQANSAEVQDFYRVNRYPVR